MGYTSTVYVGLEPKAYERAKATMIELPTVEVIDKKVIKKVKKVSLLHEFEIRLHNAELIILEADDVKWYDNYSDVKAINDFVMDANDLHGDGGFDEPNFVIAMGEDGDIHGEFGDWQEYVYITREIGLY